MQKFQPERLALLFQLLQGFLAANRITDLVSSHDQQRPAFLQSPVQPPTPTERSGTVTMCRAIGSFLDLCKSIGLSASVATIQKINRLATEPNPADADLAKLMEELLGRLHDELKFHNFFSLTARETEFYTDPLNGWASVIVRFPQTGSDIEEASKCFALSRYAATVFHSVQIIELGLIELGQFIGVNDPLSGWTAIASRLKQIVDKKYGDRTDFEKTNYPFIEQLQGTVESLKNAWRNKISHAHGKLVVMTADFSPEIAEDILYASRAFMRRLAEGLPTLSLQPSLLPPLPGPPC